MLENYRYSNYHSPLSTRTSLSYNLNDEFGNESATHVAANNDILPQSNHMNLGLDINPTQNNDGADKDNQASNGGGEQGNELDDGDSYNNSSYNANNATNANDFSNAHNIKSENDNVLETWLNAGSDNFNGTVNFFPPLSATLPLQDISTNNSNVNTANDHINKIPTPTYSPQNRLSITVTNSSSASLMSQNEISPTTSSFSGLNSSINSKSIKPKRDRSTHNIIEKKYRTNINSKILQLRDAVPALRAADPKNKLDLDELEGLTPASKLNKANILFKATEYIKHLEKKNRALLDEIKLLKLNNQSYQNKNTSCDINNKHLPVELLNQFSNQNQYEPQIRVQQQQYEFQPQNQNQNLQQFQDPSQQNLPPHLMQQIHQQIYLQMQQQQQPQQQQHQQHHHHQQHQQQHHQQQQQQQQQQQFSLPQHQIQQQTQHRGPPLTSLQQNPSLVQMQHQMSSQLSTQFPYQDQIQIQNQIQNQSQNQNQNQNQIVNSNAMPLAQKIMVGGMTALVGNQLFGNENSDFKGLSILPLNCISSKALPYFIHLIQFVTFFSCVYYFMRPFIASLNKRQKLSTDRFYLNLLSKIAFINVKENNEKIDNNEFLFSLKINDLSKAPTSNFQLLNLYIKTLLVDENYLDDKIGYKFNKIVLLKLISIKLPTLAYFFNISFRISMLQDSIKSSDSKNSKNCKIINFFKEDKSILKSESIFVQFSLILNSVKTFKSTEKTAAKLFDNANYNSIYEYLVNTPINELNKFELISVIRIVELLRSTMIYYLKILIESKSDEKIFELDKNNRLLIEKISFIENFIPSSCIKLIKCCKIFKSLLNSKNNAYLEDSLKIILLNIEQNFEFVDENDTLLDILNSNDDVLDKVLSLLNSEELNNKNLITDTNRLSLICSIILHYYSLNNFEDGEKLIKYLKNDKFKKFQCANSLSLMNLIANLKTVIAVLQHNKINDEVNRHVLEDILCCLRLYVGQKRDLVLNNSESVNIKDNQNETQKDGESATNIDINTENDDNDDDKYDDILHLHYDLKSELSEKLLELTKGLVGYDGI